MSRPGISSTEPAAAYKRSQPPIWPLRIGRDRTTVQHEHRRGPVFEACGVSSSLLILRASKVTPS